MSNKERKDKIEELREKENEVNRELNRLDRESKALAYRIKMNEVKRKDLAYQISHNMKFRNTLISELT